MSEQVTNTPDRVSIALQLEETVKEINALTNNSYSKFELGKALKEIRDNDLYKELGYNSITEWLSSPDIGITKSWAYSFISLYETFVIRLKKDPQQLPSDYTKLRDILSVVNKHPDRVDELIEQADALRRVDFRRVVREILVKEMKKENITNTENTVKIEEKDFSDLPSGEIDCIITQPPALLIKQAKGSAQVAYEKTYVDQDEQYLKYDDLAFKSYECLKDGGSIFLFTYAHNTIDVGSVFLARGFSLINMIAWQMREPKAVDITRYVDSHMNVLWFAKGEKKSYITDYDTDVWNIANKGAVVKKLLETTTTEGSVVIDPYQFDNTVETTCVLLDRNYIPLEKFK